MTRYYKAEFTFAGGYDPTTKAEGAAGVLDHRRTVTYVRVRSTASRVYTHAWFAFVVYHGDDKVHRSWCDHGFSQSRDQAERNMDAETAWLKKQRHGIVHGQVLPVTEITAREYRRLGNTNSVNQE